MKYISTPKLNEKFGVVLQALEDYHYFKNLKYGDTRKNNCNKVAWELYQNILKWQEKEIKKHTMY